MIEFEDLPAEAWVPKVGDYFRVTHTRSTIYKLLERHSDTNWQYQAIDLRQEKPNPFSNNGFDPKASHIIPIRIIPKALPMNLPVREYATHIKGYD